MYLDNFKRNVDKCDNKIARKNLHLSFRVFRRRKILRIVILEIYSTLLT